MHFTAVRDALTKGWIKNFVDLCVFRYQMVPIDLFQLPENFFRESERPNGFSIGVQNGLMILIFLWWVYCLISCSFDFGHVSSVAFVLISLGGWVYCVFLRRHSVCFAP